MFLILFFVSIYSFGCNPSCEWGQGICFFGDCYCFEGYYGLTCSEEFCAPGCKHGTCIDDAWACHCLPGWTGALCDVPICNPQCEHGTCETPNRCWCERGWYGFTCNIPACPPGCDHGFCTIPGQCDCEPGWVGDQCDYPICDPQDCNGHGTCVAPDTCDCDYRWHGEDIGGGPCEYPYCPECVFGDCWAPAPNEVCGCWTGWQGPNCDVPICDDDCGDHGTCTDPGMCTCDEGWAGELCDYEMACEWPLVGDYPECEIATCYGIPATEYGVCGYSIGHKDTGGNCIDHDVCECCCGFYTEDGSFPCQDFDYESYELCKTNPPFGWCKHRANMII